MEKNEGAEFRGVEKVFKLIDPLNKWWNVKKVKAFFRPSIAVEILRIIIMPNDQPYPSFEHEKKGEVFSIKSAYKMIMESQRLTKGESSHSSQQQSPWNSILKTSTKQNQDDGLDGVLK